MKKIPVEQAVGCALCHDLTEMRDGFKGVAFKRNHVITSDDLEHLLNMGKRHVFVWDPDVEEVHEDECALRMAAACAVEGAHFEGPSEGKVVLKADRDGLFTVDLDLLEKLNNIPDVSVSTLPNHYPVQAGCRLSSMRIVPLVTQKRNISLFEDLCRKGNLFQLLPYRNLKVGIIITGSEIYHHRIEDRFEKVLRRKLHKFPAQILGTEICDDELDMIVGAAERFLHLGAGLLIFTGGMSVDPDDLTPSAVRKLGADIRAYGVPSQPGNMSLVAYLNDVAVLGVPGAAISMPTTTLDVFLPRIFTGVQFTGEDLNRLANGGLCQLCGNCHYPNCTFGRY